jgi:hypothetical protein
LDGKYSGIKFKQPFRATMDNADARKIQNPRHQIMAHPMPTALFVDANGETGEIGGRVESRGVRECRSIFSSTVA